MFTKQFPTMAPPAPSSLPGATLPPGSLLKFAVRAVILLIALYFVRICVFSFDSSMPNALQLIINTGSVGDADGADAASVATIDEKMAPADDLARIIERLQQRPEGNGDDSGHGQLASESLSVVGGPTPGQKQCDELVGGINLTNVDSIPADKCRQIEEVCAIPRCTAIIDVVVLWVDGADPVQVQWLLYNNCSSCLTFLAIDGGKHGGRICSCRESSLFHTQL